MTVTPPEEVLEEVPELEMVPLADNEREPSHASAQGTHMWPFSRTPYHWIERRNAEGQWKLVHVRGVDRQQQAAILAAQREHNERVRANRAAQPKNAQEVASTMREEATSRLVVAKGAADVREALRGR